MKHLMAGKGPCGVHLSTIGPRVPIQYRERTTDLRLLIIGEPFSMKKVGYVRRVPVANVKAHWLRVWRAS